MCFLFYSVFSHLFLGPRSSSRPSSRVGSLRSYLFSVITYVQGIISLSTLETGQTRTCMTVETEGMDQRKRREENECKRQADLGSYHSGSPRNSFGPKDKSLKRKGDRGQNIIDFKSTPVIHFQVHF